MSEADESLLHEDNGDILPDTSYIVPYIEGIMLQRGLLVGARFQNLWRNGPRNRLIGAQKDGKGDVRPLREEKICMDWVLTFERARKLFQQIQKPEVVLSKKAQEIYQSRINRLFNTDGPTVSFGAYPEGKERENEYVNHLAIEPYSLFLAGIDDLNAALGNFAMFVIPKGIAFFNDNLNENLDYQIMVQVEEIGIYIRDTFDFEGDQALGRWKMPDQAEISIDDPSSLELARPQDWTIMNNKAYRAYRDRTNMGEDFIIYSDIKTVAVNRISVSNYTFSYRAPEWLIQKTLALQHLPEPVAPKSPVQPLPEKPVNPFKFRSPLNLQLIDIAKAIRTNLHFSQKLGWDKYRLSIEKLLGYRKVSPLPDAFARSVAKWQWQNNFPLKSIDGVIGPIVWAAMKKIITHMNSH